MPSTIPPRLVLVPTESERRLVAARLQACLLPADRIEVCGFGIVAAAARTAELIARHRPAEVMLVGIAGAITARLPIGTAGVFDRVACHGVGAGTGSAFVPAGKLGWSHWAGAATGPHADLGDVIALAADRGGEPSAGMLLTACAASATREDVCERQALYPEATAEDMEGFAVAVACRLAGIPATIVRGISNVAGDRDHNHWRIRAAADAAANLAVRLLAGDA